MIHLYRKINLCLQDIKFCVNNGLEYEKELVQRISYYFDVLKGAGISKHTKDNINLLGDFSDSVVFEIDRDDINLAISELISECMYHQ